MENKTLEDWKIGYKNGYAAGAADRLLFLKIDIAMYSPIPGYANGYRDGNNGNPPVL